LLQIQDIKEIIRKNKDLEVNELINILIDKNKILRNEAVQFVKQLRDDGSIIIKVHDNDTDTSKNHVIKFIKHYCSLDLWGLIIIFIGLLLSFYIPSLLITRYIFGFLFMFFLPGFCLINIVYPNDFEMNRLMKIVYGVILSVLISSLGLYLINLAFQYIDEFYSLLFLSIINLGLIIFVWIRRYFSFKNNLKYYDNLKNKQHIMKFILIPIGLILILAILCRVYINYFCPYYNSYIPYFNWASDHWVHYAVVRDAIKYSYLDTSYMSIYNFYYPTFYMSLIGTYYITGLDLISIFKLFPIFIGSCSVCSLILLTKYITKNWKCALITGLMISIISPAFLSSTGVTWPQLIGHYIISCLMISFYRLYKKQSLKNTSIFIILFTFLCISHIVSIVVGAIAIAISFILISFKKGFNVKIFIILIPNYIFIGVWTFLFNISNPQFGINTTFDLIKYLGLGIGGLAAGILILYLISKLINTEELQFKIEIGWLGYIILSFIILVFFNPWFWYYFPLTTDIAKFLPFDYFVYLFITISGSIIFSIFGFIMRYKINKIEFINLLGWVLGIALITAFFAMLGTFEEPSRTLLFVFEPLAIYSSFFIVKIIKSKKWKKSIFLLLIVIFTPMNLFSFTATSIGSGTINFPSEVYAADWFLNYNNWSSNTLYIAGSRGMYLNIGMYWDRSQDFAYVQLLEYLEPENFEMIRNITNEVFIGYNAMFMTSFFVKEWYFHTIYRSKIERLYITPELSEGWVNSSSRPYLKIYCNQFSDIYFVPYLNTTS